MTTADKKKLDSEKSYPLIRIINMNIEKGITIFALRIRYPDGTNEYLYDMKEKDILKLH